LLPICDGEQLGFVTPFTDRVGDTLRNSVLKVGEIFLEIFSQANRGECTNHFKTNQSIPVRSKFAKIWAFEVEKVKKSNLKKQH